MHTFHVLIFGTFCLINTANIIGIHSLLKKYQYLSEVVSQFRSQTFVLFYANPVPKIDLIGRT